MKPRHVDIMVRGTERVLHYSGFVMGEDDNHLTLKSDRDGETYTLFKHAIIVIRELKDDE